MLFCFSRELETNEPQESAKEDILQPGTSGERNQYLLSASYFLPGFTLLLIKPSDPFKRGSLSNHETRSKSLKDHVMLGLGAVILLRGRVVSTLSRLYE